MYRIALLVLVASSFAFSQQDHQAQDHQAMVNKHGDKVMGFSHEKTTHHFVLTSDGGLIEARANDIRDTASVGQIRGHFQHIVHLFAEGNFNAPMLVHSQDVPGTATMARLKGDLHWELQELPRGARITITADNKEALDAVHDFLRFQIADHITGDCTAVR
ncbi:MAG: hypothetical protein LAO24_02095 [Acidobacteriia bacterium]|nr:hypothetical protein [Terriglobia bacterium]